MNVLRYLGAVRTHPATECNKSQVCQCLERVLAHRQTREDLIREMLSSHADLERVVEVRFASAVSEVEVTKDRSERRRKAESISEVFLRGDSRYRLGSAPEDMYQERCSNGFLKRLSRLKSNVIEGLAQDLVVKRCLSAIQPVPLDEETGTKIDAAGLSPCNLKCAVS